MRYIAYVDSNKKIALARSLGNESIRSTLTRVSQLLGYTPVYYTMIAATEEECKLIINYTFGEDMYFISAFNNPT